MQTIVRSILVLAAASAACFAQRWEFGGAAGAGFLNTVAVTSPLGAATTGFQSGASFGAFFGQNLYPHLSGEVRYAYLQSNLRIQSGGSQTTFAGASHVAHFDLVVHTNRKGSRAQYFAAFGGGLKIFRGTGKEAAYQPLSQFAYFTRTQVVKPMASVGGGVKFALAPHVILRTEIRDYITAFPKEVIAPAPGAKFGSLLHDLVPMAGISYEY